MSFSSSSTPSTGYTTNPFFNLLKKNNSNWSSRDGSSASVPHRSSNDTTPLKASLFHETIGFSTLPDQIHRKTLKKGFEFTVMVVGTESSYVITTNRYSTRTSRLGEHGLGKSTFINTLFMTELYADRPATMRRRH
jgi:hypothetical protein